MAVASRPLARPFASTRGEPGDKLGLTLQILAYLVLIAVAFAMLVPFLFSISTSIKTNAEANTLSFANLFVPANPTLGAYTTVWEANIGRWFFNSAIVAAVWVIARAIFDSMAGYAFARMSFPGKNLIFLMVLSTLMVPGMVTLIPKFLILDKLNLLNSYGALTLPFLTSAFGIFLMKQFFESIPLELEEAARVDGASRYRMFVQIILPNAMPALTALAIFSFQGSWNNFLEPLVYISNADLFTLPIGLAFFRQANYTDWPAVMAAAVITTVPIAVFYLFFQRYFVEGVTTSGIKG
ncbi:MAG: carbohydrate ABC transporter permease [Chloroflexia bacterium]|jgi:multiple sugar transport system permease protein|nr:carbohydrate ABC transporter permease [Chloroflexia bacterium]